jgi:outer membrane protein OmpA-like peptidoglycan-associated protein
MKKIVTMVLLLLNICVSAQVGVNTESILTTISLKDKSNSLITDKEIKILNTDKTIAAEGKTDQNGEFKAKLKRGVSYTINFNEAGRDWVFDLLVTTDLSATYFRTACKIPIDKGAQGTITESEKYCEVKFTLTDPMGTMLPSKKFKLDDLSGLTVFEGVTDVSGNCIVNLKQNKVFTIKTAEGMGIFSSDISVPNKEQAEIGIVVKGMDFENEIKGKCRVNFEVTDEIGVAEGAAKITVKQDGYEVFSSATDINGKCTGWVNQHHTYDVVLEKFGKTFPLKLEMPMDTVLSIFDYKIRIKTVENYIRTFVLENVYFDTDKWDLKPESYGALDNLFINLNSNPKMKVELAGYTDSDGEDVYNMELSQRRADAVKAYIVKRGIDSKRILAKGYGEKLPRVPNTTDENKALNRRTEVKVISE